MYNILTQQQTIKSLSPETEKIIFLLSSIQTKSLKLPDSSKRCCIWGQNIRTFLLWTIPL